MVVHRVTPLINETADLVGVSSSDVEKVINHVLGSVKEYLQDPKAPGFRIPHFGTFRPYSSSLTSYLKRLILLLRDPNTPPEKIPSIQEEFRRFWNLRKLVQKDNERRNFKRRFGSWHWKGKEHDIDRG